MRLSLLVVAVCVALSACAPKPQIYAEKLAAENDPKFNSPECLSIREKALTYDDKTAERAVTGLALGLFLGPFGLPFAIAGDSSQNEDRRAFAAEVHRRCSSKPLPKELEPPKNEATNGSSVKPGSK